MKKNLFLYLFIFAVLINIFTYMYFTNSQKHEQGRITSMQESVRQTRDSLQAMQARVDNADFFSLQYNMDAQQYFGGQDINTLAIKVEDGIYAMNGNDEGNPLTQYPPFNNKPFIIGKMKILNHRWIIAEFSNGSASGEILIKYFVEDNGEVTYETLQSHLYPHTVN